MRNALSGLLLLSFFAVAQAQPVDTERISAVALALLDTGADGAALAELANAEAQSAGMLDDLGPERSGALRDAWGTAFGVDLLRQDVVNHIARRESAIQAAEALAWLRKPEVMRATSRMREAVGQEFDNRFGRWMATLDEAEIDRERVELAALISRRSGEERVGEIVMMLAEAGVRGAHAVIPRDGRPSLDRALRGLRELGATIEAQAVTQNQLYIYYVLRDLSPNELQAYAEALDSPEGRWYVRVIGDAFVHAIDEATERLVTEAQSAASAIR